MVENTPFYQGQLDWEAGKENAPAYYSPQEKKEWHDGWNEAQTENEPETGTYLLMESFGGRWENVAPDENFTNLKAAEDYASDNDYIDCAIMKFEKFV